jgi:hypothetical protein
MEDVWFWIVVFFTLLCFIYVLWSQASLHRDPKDLESESKHAYKLGIAIVSMVISLPLILNDVASSPTLVVIVLGVWIVRMLWLSFIIAGSQIMPGSVREPTRKELRGDMIGLAITLVAVFVVYPWCADYAQQNVRKSAEAFYGQLQIGAAFDRAAFDRQIEGKDGRVRNFGNHREVMEAVGATKAIWDRRTLYPIEVAVLAADDVERYHMWFRASATWRTLWGSVTTAPVDYVFHVENGKIAGISDMEHGGYVREISHSFGEPR